MLNKLKSYYITTYFPLFIIIITSILSFLPSLINYKYDFKTIILMNSVDSIEQLNSMSVAVGVSVPMFLEIIMDYKDISFDMLIPRILCSSGLFIPNLIYLLSYKSNATLFLNVVQSRSTLIAGGLLLSLFNSGDSLLHKIFVLITTPTCAAYIMVSTWSLDGKHFSLTFILYGLYAISAAEAVFISIWYAKKVISDWPAVTKSTSRKSTLIHAVLITIYAIGFQAIGAAFNNTSWGKTRTNELIAYNCLDIFITVLAISIPSRLLRQENLKVKHALESKKRFVRYISHEIRTPLNTVSVGIQLLQKTILSLESDMINILSPLQSSQSPTTIITHFSTTQNFNNNNFNNNTNNNINISEDITNKLSSLQKIIFCDMKGIIEDITLSCQSSINILNDLLVYDKVEEGHLFLRKQYLRIIDCIIVNSKPFHLLAHEGGINFDYIGKDISLNDTNEYQQISNIVVCIDTFKIAQVIRNFLSNAFKHTPRGGSVKLTARVINKLENSSTEENKSYIRLEVIDSGSGVSPENQSKLFSTIVQFHTESVENTQDGSGLGLYIAAAIVRKHGGDVGVYSSGIPGEGSIFYLDLPIIDNIEEKRIEDIKLITPSLQETKKGVAFNSVVPLTSDLPSVDTRSPSPSPLSPINQHTSSSPSSLYYDSALVVDDSTLTRKMLVKSITNYFTTVIQGSDGLEAVSIIKDLLQQGNPPNIVFLDSVMPNMSGIDACREIRALGYQGVIIAVTGNVLPSDIEEFICAGADKLVPKPFRVDDIKSILEDYRHKILSGPFLNSTRKETSHSSMV